MTENKIGFEDEEIKLEIKDGIMRGTYKEGVVIDRAISSRMIRERIRLSEGRTYPVLGDSTGVRYWTLYSRNNDMKKEAYNLINYAALVIPSKKNMTIWNFTIRLFPPPIPVKVFEKLEDAEDWLKLQAN